MNWDEINWAALEQMRMAFLAGTAGDADYWVDDSFLAAYDATFAQRIGWKWDFVLSELQMRGWSLPSGPVMDWGCGSGVAGRALLDYFGTAAVKQMLVWDRSVRAMNYAVQRARTRFPELQISATHRPDVPEGGTLLLSHVLTELNQEQTEKVVTRAGAAATILWVEPGTYEASLTLIAIRERLRHSFNLVAPCPHQGRCGILAAGNERHWCHHFATPPAKVFTDSGWARFANLMNIDLRDLPLSFLVLDKRPIPALPVDAGRLIGHPRLCKGHAQLLGCDASGVHERRLSQRKFPSDFKQMKKGRHGSLFRWKSSEGELAQLSALI